MTKFQSYYQEMWEAHKDILAKFQDVHDQYQKNQRDQRIKVLFDQIGRDARTVMEDWDQRLCSHMEKGANGKFSSKVSEKFWAEIKKDFPLVELVGVEVSFAR